MDINYYDPSASNGLLQTAQQVGGNAAQTGIGYGMGLRGAKNDQQSALQKLAMLKISQAGQRQGWMRDLQKQLTDLGIQNQQATPLDEIGAGLGGVNALIGLKKRDAINSQYGLQPKSGLDYLFGGL